MTEISKTLFSFLFAFGSRSFLSRRRFNLSGRSLRSSSLYSGRLFCRSDLDLSSRGSFSL